MNMKKTLISTLSAIAALTAFNASASDGTITFNGEVINQTCEVNPAGSSDFTVDLPAVATSQLATAGTTAGETPFTIDLANCDLTKDGAYAFFEAGGTVDENGRLINNGNATNVALELVDVNNKVIKAGDAQQADSSSAAVIDANGNASLSYTARYYATGAATAGTVTTSVTYSIAYL
ncbi:fimbrial protein [Erwinia sp. CGal63]|uniref:fimbrial protein n=1 Tax=Erwinia sp. CGal63 TaxID=2919889 RepID=UPI0030087EEF